MAKFGWKIPLENKPTLFKISKHPLFRGLTSSSKEEEVLEVLQEGELIGLSSLADFLGEPTHTTMPHDVGVRALEESNCLLGKSTRHDGILVIF
jgi:hypothetical protein